MKICFKCQEKKPLSEFYKHKRMADGHLNKCKKCTKHDVIQNRQENVEYYKQYDRWRAQTFGDRSKPKPFEIAAKYRKKWAEKNKHKIHCHVAVNKAVASGKLIKPEHCQKCGGCFAPSKIHAHHSDYSKPLDVIWLCFSCHAAEHAHDVSNFKPRAKWTRLEIAQ